MLPFHRAERWIWLLIPGMATLALLAGCGGAEDDLPREAVSGTVKLDGEPMKTGLIQFRPASQSEATSSGAAIVDGQYSISKGEGLVPGKYQVAITSNPAESAPTKSGMPGDAPPTPPAKEPIPAKFNSQSKLTAEVTKGGPNKFDYDLTSK